MISTYKISDDGKKIIINTPYSDVVAKQCRAWAGKYEKGKGWIVNISRLDEVQRQLGKQEGNIDEVEVEVSGDQIEGYAQIRVGWFILAGRRGRDDKADVYAELVDGYIPSSGGSAKNPGVQQSSDAKFRLWVPRDFAVLRNLKITDEGNNGDRGAAKDPVEAFSAVLRKELAKSNIPPQSFAKSIREVSASMSEISSSAIGGEIESALWARLSEGLAELAENL